MKKIGIIIGVVAVVCVGAYTFFAQPKLEANLLATGTLPGGDNAIVLTLGNAGIQEIQVIDVLVNNSDRPNYAKVQIKTKDQGFVISKPAEQHKGYKFVNYDKVSIEPGTSQKDLGDVDSKYGLTIVDDKVINSVIIRYSYLGKKFEKTVTIDS